MARNFKSVRYPIATVHAAPLATSPTVASIYEEMRFAGNGDGEFSWTVELVSKPGVFLPWPEGQAAFDYGLHIAGVQRRDGWVRLLSSIPVDGWLRIANWPKIPETAPIFIYVEPLESQVMDLSTLTASWPDGNRRQIAEGPYLILKVTADSIEFRSEIPSDFACSEPVTDPVPLPPTLRATASEFFNRDGTPRFFKTYTKGC